MDPIKDAFGKVKEDIFLLKNEFKDLKKELSEIQSSILELFKLIYSINQESDRQIDKQTDKLFNNNLDRQTKNPFFYNYSKEFSNSTQDKKYDTIRHKTPTQDFNKFDNSTGILYFKSLKNKDLINSTGNNGVSTDRQTDTSTDTSTGNKGVSTHNSSHNKSNTSFVLSELDNIKQDLKFKIKSLTNQEMLVLSTVYQREDQGFLVDYAFISDNLNISQSSVRDYIQRIIKKGILLEKEKINNKKIILHIPQEIKKLATLNTLLSLREL
jgi:DNA-binding MarR family transcriptional regulator